MPATHKLTENDPGRVGRYLADQLTDEERAAFEARLVEDPQLLQELEATARLKVGLENLRRSGQLERLVRPRPVLNRNWVALAASISVLMVGAILWRGFVQMGDAVLAPSADLPVAGSYALLRTRANTYDAVLQLPATPQSVELRVLPDTKASPEKYRVMLSRLEDGGTRETVATITGLTPAEDGFVTFYADSSKLSAGRYQLSISGDAGTSSQGLGESFLIRVEPADSR